MSRAPVPGRIAVPALTAAYGALVIVANARNDIVASDFTRDWVLLGDGGGFPGDFGRNVFAGSIALGVLFLVLAATAWLTAGRTAAVGPAALGAVLSLLLLVAYRDDGNLLAARPASAAVMLAVALYVGSTTLLTSRASRHDEAPR